MQEAAERYQPMSSVPRDGQLVRLWLRDGTDFIGYYSAKWWGWVDYRDPVPLIRGDIRFLGWEPVDQAEPLIRREQGHRGAPVVVEPAAPALTSRIVRARRPGRVR
jgi:hypothetical protein